MPATEYQGSFLGRISIRRNQVIAMDGSHEQDLEDVEIFQKNIADRFSDLLSPPSPTPRAAAETFCLIPTPGSISKPNALLSIAWLRKLLDVYLCCEAEFKAFLIMGRDPSALSKPPHDRLIPELLDRSVKALDILNAVMHGVDSLRQLQKFAEIAVAALDKPPLGEGQVRRAKKALTALIAAMGADDKDGQKSTERSWSFGRRGGGNSNKDRAPAYFRSPAWGVSKTWSAAKQIQAMSSNLTPPRGADSSGLALTVYIMSSVTVFVMWAIVAAVPCQERTGLATNFQIPRQLPWAQPIIGLQDNIGEEWKKKEKKGSFGLLEEIQRIEKAAQSLIEFADSFQFPAEAERLEEAATQVAELSKMCQRMEEGLVPLQQQIRELFHRIVRSRTDVIDVLDQAGKANAPAM